MYTAGRLLYTWGYSTGNAERRKLGQIGSVGLVGLLGTSLYTGVQLFI